ncbi:FtsQ-type POTRA domain-containing protein [Sphingomonas sp. AP4-R1]|uniref:cell division protein FtsQ/DivIB n=1 Tax=Sphingomonas sp. AP4-R1 TaxID=2735134 RepID=UPI001493C204|nr:FtsQ-type POTRA domain-containing protein [Sphingomonas sp. AP4-R1]QJU57835.1 FtsQ-type POTRA domain-containing protein [Sphingomonas sp. AP4-R1]
MSAKAAPKRTRPRPATSAARRAPARARPPARTRGPSAAGAMISRAFKALPLPEGFLKSLGNWTLSLLLVGGVGAGVVAMGVPGMVGLALSHAIGRAGFVVHTIEVNGRAHVDRDAVYRVAMDSRGQDMPLVDLEGIRQSLMGLAWVEDARVSRRLPDTLIVDIVERKPAGVWQHDYKLSLIDGEGRVIAPVDPSSPMDQLPLVIGTDANLHAGEFAALIASQPVLKPLIEGATWIGGRRWDVRFQSGETLMLPEGDKAARDAFALFARKDSEARLLGQGIVRFDMRVPDRMVVRMSSEPGAKVTPPQPANQI